jgi:hypothetical protein
MKRMSLLALGASLVMSAFGQSTASRIVIENPSATALKEQVVSIPWETFSARCAVTDTNGFRIIDPRTKREVPVQLERMGKSGVQSLLLQVDIPAGGSLTLNCVKGQRAPVKAKTYGRYIPERKDDFAWENDRIAFRAYGKALENTRENAHGLDVWVKRSRELVVNERYRRNDYHKDNGDGLDYYHVGFTLGAGNIAPYWQDSVWYPGNYSRWELLDNGPLRSTFRLYYDPVTLHGHKVSSVKTISIDAGTYMNRITAQYDIAGMDSLPVVIGIVTRKDPGRMHVDEQQGIMTYWEPTDPKWGTTTVGIVSPVSGKLRVTPLQILLQTRIATNKPFTYHMGAAWDREGVMQNAAAWEAWVAGYQQAQAAVHGLRVSYK